MVNKKYELTDETMEFRGHTLHRIKALKSFGGNIKSGDLGGWIESEHNLDSRKSCWIYNNAKVYGDAIVIGDAYVKDNAVICGNSLVQQFAHITDNAYVYNSNVFDNAHIINNASIFDSEAGANAYVRENAIIRNNSLLLGVCNICGHAIIDHTFISDRVEIGNYANIINTSGYLYINIASSFSTFYKSDDKIMMQGPICSGSLDDFIKIVIEEGNTPKYLPMINYVKSYFGEE